MTRIFLRFAALAALMVSLIQIPALLLVRAAFLDLHPDYLDDPPTISRAINDPLVGVPFARGIWVTSLLLAVAVPVIVVLFWRAVNAARLGARARLFWRAAILAAAAGQVAASVGMNLLADFTFRTNHDMHMLGSYVFFAAQALTILIAACLCRALAARGPVGYLLPFMQRLRFRLGMVVVGLALAYLFLFFAKDWDLPVPHYGVQVAYTQCEVAVISAFMLFLSSFSVDIWAMARGGGGDDDARNP